MDGVAVFTFFFKLVFYWPFRILFLLTRWIVERFQDASYAKHVREHDTWVAGLDDQREESRRSRSTLYGGSSQPDK
jgi:hypothetical protein